MMFLGKRRAWTRFGICCGWESKNEQGGFFLLEYGVLDLYGVRWLVPVPREWDEEKQDLARASKHVCPCRGIDFVFIND